MLKKILIAEMTSPEFREALKETDTAVIPVGSTEVLGTHGPLGTDFFVAEEVARKVGERAQCLVAPALPVGDALELIEWPGTISIRFDVLKAFYLDVCHSLVRHGVKRIFFLNTHLMNMRAIDDCGRTLRREGIAVSQGDWWRVAFSVAGDLVESSENPYGHGGEVITSVIMALKPGWIDLSKSTKERPKSVLDFHVKRTPAGGGPFYTYPNFSDYCESGGWGDPSFATREKGATVIERATEKIVAFIEEFKSQPLPIASPQ